MNINRFLLALVISTLVVLTANGVVYTQDVIDVVQVQPEPTPDDGSVTIEVDVNEAEQAAEAAVNLTEATGEATLTTTERWMQSLNTLPQNAVLQVLFVLGGALLLVGGWRIYDWVVFLAGGFVGAAILTSLVVSQSLIAELLLALVGFALGAFLTVFVYYLAVFAVGGYMGILLTNAVAGAFGVTIVSPFVLLIAVIIGGVILLALASELVVVIAALVGAQLLTLALALPAYWTLVLAIASVFLQFFLANRFRYNIRRRPNRRLFRRMT